MAAYRWVDGFKSPAGWLPVNRDQVRAQRSITNLEERYLFNVILHHYFALGSSGKVLQWARLYVCLFTSTHAMFIKCCLSVWLGPLPAGWRNPKGKAILGVFFPIDCVVSVCPRGYLQNHTWSLSNFLCMLPLAVARSSSGFITIRYLLPVLWMASCFFIVGHIAVCILLRRTDCA